MKGNSGGLIACHHYSSAKYINNFLRNAATIEGHFITSQISVRQIAERNVYSQRISAALEKMLALNFTADRSMFNIMAEQKELLDLCHASGVVIFVEDGIYTGGSVPTVDDVQKLLGELKSRRPLGSLHFDRLLDVYPDAEKLSDVAAGILYHRFDVARNIGVIWFRHETIAEVHWAGNPAKAIIKDENGLHPRNSFGLWKEVVKFTSTPWLDSELAAASTFGRNLERHAHLLFINEEQSRSRQLNEALTKTNSELENINWISTHDLKEPLRKIKLFASRILTLHGEELNESVIDSINKMNNSAHRMQTLISDLLEYARVRNSTESLEHVSLSDILHEVDQLLTSEDNERTFELNIGSLPTVMGVQFLLVQLFVNLLRNSIKFSRDGVPLKISVTASAGIVTVGFDSNHYYEVIVSDNGIGFDNEYRESIFNVFTRLHTLDKYNGTGIGLALCRKVMGLHKGLIKASGKLGEGAEFRLYFPA